MTQVILDTNMMLAPSQFKIDIIAELEKLVGVYELFVVDKTVKELNRLQKEGSGADKQAALYGLQMIDKLPITVIETSFEGYADDAIVEEAASRSCYVATLDKRLKERLQEKGIKVIIMRQKKFLVIDEKGL